jgi:hypothetical protein
MSNIANQAGSHRAYAVGNIEKLHPHETFTEP